MRLATLRATTLLFFTILLTALSACSETRPAVRSQPVLKAEPAGNSGRDFSKWEKAIAAYEAMDRAHFPPRNGVLFIGSSTIRRWKTLDKDFPDNKVINRGFGGSHIVDSIHFAERIIFPYEPRMIVLRAGGCDINAGKSPEQVFADWNAFVAMMHARLPKTQIVYISINPSPAGWKNRDRYKAINALIEKSTHQQPYLKYLEMYDAVLGPDGRPRSELYVEDKVHFNGEGYRLLADRMRPLMPK